MDFFGIAKILRSGAKSGLCKIKWTGGEPTVRKDFLEIVRFATEIGYSQQSMTSNGVLLYDMAFDLRAAGLQKINVSLDATNAEKFKEITGHDKFDDVIKSLKHVADVFKYVGINSVIYSENKDNVAGIVNLAQQLDSDCEIRVKFIEMMPDNNDYENDAAKYAGQFVSAKEIIRLLGQNGELIGGRFNANREFKHITYKYEIKDKNGFYLVVPLNTENRECVKGACPKIRVNPKGKISPCSSEMSMVQDFSGLSQEECDAAMEQLVFNKENMSFEGLSDNRRYYQFWRFGREVKRDER